MSIYDNEALVRRFIEGSGTLNGDVTGIPDFYNKYFAPSFIAHYSTGDMNYAQYLKYIMGVITAFPDLRTPLLDMIAQGDKVAARYSLQGTHTQGTFGGVPATGRAVNIQLVVIFRIAEGKFAELWAFPNEMGLLRQLGVMPEILSRK
jgi:steroid delta-isomerase-like uncharacterized protein